jgi:flagellar assembly protein FliH
LSERILKSSRVFLGSPLDINPASLVREMDNGIPDEIDGDGTDDPFDSEISREIYDSVIEKANSEAVRIIDEAKVIADKMISEAGEKVEDEMEKCREEGRRQGFEEGLREGKEEALRKHEELIKEAESIRDKANEDYANILKSAEEDIATLVMNVARKVINTELTTNRKIILNLVSEAMMRSSNRDSLVIKVSREDYDFVKENEESIKERVDGLGFLDIKTDPSLNTGSCIVETHYGCIDSSIETRMERLKTAFQEAIKTRG